MTRRRLFAAALAAGLVRPGLATAENRDRSILRSLIAREEGAVFAYRAAPLPGLEQLGDQDDDHVAALKTELQALYSGATPITLDAVDEAVRRVRDAKTVAERHAAAIALETELVDAYRDAVVALTEPAILQTAATILASHAQRRALLSAARYSQ